MKRIPVVIYGILLCTIIIIDRLTKYWALTMLTQPYSVNEYLSFELLFNRGISWSFFHSPNPYIFAAVSFVIFVLIVALVFYTLIRWMNHYSIIGEIMIIAGAVSNMVDRVLYKGVIDFIIVSYKSWVWPAFNIADASIVLGVVILLFTGLHEP